jgi:hypothetical protein
MKKKKREETKKALAIFFSRCISKKPRRECMLDYNEILIM